MLSKELGPSAGCRLRENPKRPLLGTSANCHPLMTGGDDHGVFYDQDKPNQVMRSTSKQPRAPPPSGLKPLAVTFKTGSQITGLGLTTLWKLAKEERIEIMRVCRRTLIIYASLERLIFGAEPQPVGAKLPKHHRGRPTNKLGRKGSSAALSNRAQANNDPDT